MRVTDIQDLFAYNAWANERILAAATGITDEQFVAPTHFSGASLRGCLLHIVNALRFHLSSWQEQPLQTDLRAVDFPSVTAFAMQWARDEAPLQDFVATLTDADLEQPRSLTFTSDGVRITAPLWKLILHNLNHATQHRSDAAQILTDLGHSPGDLDFSDILPTTQIEG